MTPEQNRRAKRQRVRLQEPDRFQVALRPMDLDSLIDSDHRVRLVWAHVQTLDLSALYDKIKAVPGQAGRTPISPDLLFAIWMWASLEGVGSARLVAKLCEESAPYRWLCGGVSVNHHTLSDFRVGTASTLENLLVDEITAMRAAKLVTMERLTIDGTKVRASAGSGSFRRRARLDQLREETAKVVEQLRTELEDDPNASSDRRKKASAGAAAKKLERLARARQVADKLAKKRKAKDREKARASTTDPDATVMKMADGGYRPAYNVQVVASGQLIVHCDVVTAGNDMGQLAPQLEAVIKQYDVTPKEILADSGYAKKADIETVVGRGVRCIIPPQKPKTNRRDANQPHRTDSEVIRQWRSEMQTEDAKRIYKERSPCELINARLKNGSLYRTTVRGIQRVKAAMLWVALANNFSVTRLNA